MIGALAERPLFLLLLLLLPAGFLAWRRWPPPLGRGRSRFALVFRALLVLLLVLALAGVHLTTQPTQRALVAVVDLSASVKAGGGLAAEDLAVRRLEAGRGPDDLFGVVTFGHDAAVEMPLTRSPDFQGFQTQPDPSYSNLAAGLRLAAGLIPDGYARQLVLISDGRENLDDAASSVAALRAEGVRVDAVGVGGPPAAEALVASVQVANEIRAGQTAVVTVHLQSTGHAQGKLTLIADQHEVANVDVTLPAGASAQTFSVPDLAQGLHVLRAELTVTPDTYPENNEGQAAVRVLGRPLVLVLEGKVGEGVNVARALEAEGMTVDRRLAAAAPTDTAELGRYDGTVIVDAAADRFAPAALTALAASVHDLGRGLFTVGGPEAYGPGGWQGTPLEAASPVQMDIPKRKDKPRVAVVLVMESMEDPRADQVVLGAAEAVIDQLDPADQVAVTDGQNGFLVPMTPVSDKKAIFAKLEGASLGDPPSYQPFLQQASAALLKTDAPLKHMVLLGDGDADSGSGQQAPVQTLLQQTVGQGITTSAVAVDVHGQPQYMAYMQDMARWGGGRFYLSNDPSQVPQLFLKESVTALRPWFEQTPFFPRIGAVGGLLDGLDTGAFPQLGGYVVTTAKPAAEQYLISPKQDPVLAAWSYGLGRSAAWTSDSTGIWTGGLLRLPLAAQLFARAVAWTLPGEGGALSIDAQPSGDGLQVSVTGPITGGNVGLGIVRPDLSSGSEALVATAPGQWQGRIPNTPVGLYLLHASLQAGGRAAGQADTAVAVPYSPEYLELGRDPALLRAVAKAGGGGVLSAVGTAWRLPLPPVPVSSAVFWLLLLAAAVLWPVDVAARRIPISPRRLLANFALYARERRMADLEVAAPSELARLRSRIEHIRARSLQPRARGAGPPSEVTPETPIAGAEGSPPPAAEAAAAEQ
ncbi:MAG: VWA domain-containing protein, partial [Candidatus Dormibacteraeota bacterium]|nr:VWA domain-containing protein [Candidatus Dormibacteraeota bacterium]